MYMYWQSKTYYMQERMHSVKTNFCIFQWIQQKLNNFMPKVLSTIYI